MAKPSYHVVDLRTLLTLTIPRGGGKHNASNKPYPEHAHPAKFGAKAVSAKSADELASQVWNRQ